ncbi:MAG: hypothetical protein HFI51_05115 [Lachnospiraceae bacterium]|jgi:hypothetical protein|nr:hypothetical protein [Lachnospiraceae bacterium]
MEVLLWQEKTKSHKSSDAGNDSQLDIYFDERLADRNLQQKNVCKSNNRQTPSL